MENKVRSNYLVVLFVFIVGLSVTILLQSILLQTKSKEERYDFESQVSNLTLFITDNLTKIESQFNLLATMAEVSKTFNSDNYLARFSQLSFPDRSAPIAFSIFGRDPVTKKYSLRHMSGKYAAKVNKKLIESEIEKSLLSIIHGPFEKLNSRKTNNFFIELELVGKISCLSRMIFEKKYQQKIIISCFKLDEILDEVIGRSSYGWLEAFLYLGGNENSYKSIYSYSDKESFPISNPSSMNGDDFIFLPWVLSFANHELSILFSSEGYTREIDNFQFIPSFLGASLTLLICSYLISLKKRNNEIGLKVEEKTKAYYKLNLDLEKEIEKKELLYEQLDHSSEELKSLTNSVNGVIWEANPKTMEYLYISDQVENILGYKSKDYLSGKLRLGGEKVKEGAESISTLMENNFEGLDNFTIEYQAYRKDNKLIWQRNIISKIFQLGDLVKVRGVIFDITEEKNLEEQRVLMEGQLKHAQKMEAIGQLAAGIAHEINTPSQFVGDNLNFISDSTKDLSDYQSELENLIQNLNIDDASELLTQTKEKFDIDFLETEIPLAIEQSIDGVSRISKIVSAMKDFSHPVKEDKQKVDINRSIESTSIVARNEWKYLANLQFDFSDNLPKVNCFPGEINQVILNMIVNACHAIEDTTGGKEKGNILISTLEENEHIIIKIKDDGAGMDPTTKERIFDPFFTTKEVGQGTGQGLSLAYSVIVEKHSGHISVESAPGSGTTFIIQLPID